MCESVFSRQRLVGGHRQRGGGAARENVGGTAVKSQKRCSLQRVVLLRISLDTWHKRRVFQHYCR
jgi:hypothetical protein